MEGSTAHALRTAEDAEGEAVAELVVANRVLAMLGLVDAFGHIAARHPGHADRYLMARGVAPELVTEGDIACFDLDSDPVPAGGPQGSLERFIHGAVFKARPDVQAVVHTHSPRVVAFSVSRTPLRPLSHTGAFLLPAVPVFEARDVVGPNDFMISSNALGDAMALELGAASVVLLAAHGNVVVGPSIGAAVYRTHHTEKSAELLLAARELDGPLRFIEPDEAELAGALRSRGYVRQWELWKQQARALARDQSF